MPTRPATMKRISTRWLIAALIALGAAPSVWAQTPFDILYCDAGTVNLIYDSKELKVLALEGKGVTMSQHENKALDKLAFEFIGNYTIVDGKRTGTGYMTFKDSDGDYILWEFAVGVTEKTYTFFLGTGKWAGIKGSGTGTTSVVGRIKPNTFQSCSRVTGSFELRK